MEKRGKLWILVWLVSTNYSFGSSKWAILLVFLPHPLPTPVPFRPTHSSISHVESRFNREKLFFREESRDGEARRCRIANQKRGNSEDQVARKVSMGKRVHHERESNGDQIQSVRTRWLLCLSQQWFHGSRQQKWNQFKNHLKLKVTYKTYKCLRSLRKFELTCWNAKNEERYNLIKILLFFLGDVAAFWNWVSIPSKNAWAEKDATIYQELVASFHGAEIFWSGDRPEMPQAYRDYCICTFVYTQRIYAEQQSESWTDCFRVTNVR